MKMKMPLFTESQVNDVGLKSYQAFVRQKLQLQKRCQTQALKHGLKAWKTNPQ